MKTKEKNTFYDYANKHYHEARKAKETGNQYMYDLEMRLGKLCERIAILSQK